MLISVFIRCAGWVLEVLLGSQRGGGGGGGGVSRGYFTGPEKAQLGCWCLPQPCSHCLQDQCSGEPSSIRGQ